MTKRNIILALALACAVALAAPGLDAKKHGKRGQGSRDGGSFITKSEIAALEKSGHLVPQGPDSWKTRGGVVLKGRDPDGRNRLEHVMRHTRDIPSRPRHSVFSVSKAQVIELMDEAWAKIKSGSLKAEERGGRSAYVYRAGRDIGYAGGRDGAQRGRRPLKAVKIVVKTGTPEVVTFFPR